MGDMNGSPIIYLVNDSMLQDFHTKINVAGLEHMNVGIDVTETDVTKK